MKKYAITGSATPLVRPVKSGDQTGGLVEIIVATPANANRPVDKDKLANTLSNTPVTTTHGWYRKIGKRTLDVLFVVATIPISVPIILFGAIALWIEGGQPFYRQDRLGRNGKLFSILKLRSMVRDAEGQLEQYLSNDPNLREEWETTQKLKSDPRVTRVGAFLRATSLDELPQLWNVLKGEMSLVGPRPMQPEQLPLYGDASAYFALQPGITGMWQISARNEERFSFRAEVDTQYCYDISLQCDLRLLLKTVGVVLRRTGY